MIRRKARTSKGRWDPHSQSVVGAKEGKDPKGIELKITSWRNPGRSKRGMRSNRDYGPQADRWGSLWQIIVDAPIKIFRA
jgi:hypothetical protein